MECPNCKQTTWQDGGTLILFKGEKDPPPGPKVKRRFAASKICAGCGYMALFFIKDDERDLGISRLAEERA